MCNAQCVAFAATALEPEDVRGKEVLEVGSYAVNGSIRPVLVNWNPAKYVGVDIAEGPSVDIVCDAEGLVEHFGPNSFDVVVTTEMLEHVRNWRTVLSNLKRVLRPGGKLLITTRSYGMPYHAWPYDFWRYELEDMKQMLTDFKIKRLEPDPLAPGVFVLAEKPRSSTEADLRNLRLYSIITDERITDISDARLKFFLRAYRRQEVARSVISSVHRSVVRILARLFGLGKASRR